MSAEGPTAQPSGLSLRDRVLRYYRANAPEHVNDVDEILASSQFSEEALMSALVAKYGRDLTTTEIYRTQPLRSLIVDYEFVDGNSKKDASRPTGNQPSNSSGAEAGNGPQVEGGSVLTQLVLDHLAATGLRAVAETFRNDLVLCGCPATFFEPEESPIQLRSNATTTSHLSTKVVHGSPHVGDTGGVSAVAETAAPSPLVRLLCPAASTREKIAQLMHDMPRRITAGLGVARRDDASLQLLTEMSEAAMWMEPLAEAKISYVHHSSGKLRAATLNQLVEHMTRVSFQPHVSVTKKELDAERRFVLAMILTHRHFTTSQCLLAKLLQRFFVPATLPLGDRFDRHGISISNPNGVFSPDASYASKKLSKRMLYFMEVTKRIQIKVLTVISTWIREAPQHFDKSMIDAVFTFIDEVCYVPTMWSDTPIELMQCAEVIKILLRRVCEWQRSEGSEASHQLSGYEGGGYGAPSAVLGSGIFSPSTRSPGSGARGAMGSKRKKEAGGERASSVSFLFAKHKTSNAITRYELHRHLDPSDDPPSNRGNSISPPQTAGTIQAKRSTIVHVSVAAMNETSRKIAELLDIDELRLANQMTTMDHALFRRIDAAELFIFATQNGALRLHMTNHPALHLNAFLHRSEDVMHWVASEILTAAKHALDAHHHAQVSRADPGVDASRPPSMEDAQRVLTKFVSLAFRSLEMNNLQGAFAILSGLRHPAVTRLQRTLWAGLSPSTLSGFAELSKLFDFSRGYANYKNYVAVIPDLDVYPALPLVSVWIDEIRRLETTQPTVLRDLHGNPVIHWRKFDVLFTICDLLRSAQTSHVPAEFEELPECTEWVSGRILEAVHDVDALLALSVAVESADDAPV